MRERTIEILESTPAKLAAEVGPLTATELGARPRPDRWSIVEVLAHLDDAEELAMRSRIAAIVEADKPVLPAFDQNRRARDMNYANKDSGTLLASFTRQRRQNVAWVKTLSLEQLTRTGTHPRVGLLSAGDLLHEWAFHDLGHLKQILEIKRYALYPHIGNMRQFYALQWG